MAKSSYYGSHFEKRKYLKLPKGEMSTSYRMLLQGPHGYIICRDKTPSAARLICPMLVLKWSELKIACNMYYRSDGWHSYQYSCDDLEPTEITGKTVDL